MLAPADASAFMEEEEEDAGWVADVAVAVVKRATGVWSGMPTTSPRKGMSGGSI